MLANQEKLRYFGLALKYKYGFQVPCDYNHVKILDNKNKQKNGKTVSALK